MLEKIKNAIMINNNNRSFLFILEREERILYILHCEKMGDIRVDLLTRLHHILLHVNLQ